MSERFVDRDLDVGIVATLVADQFPDLKGGEVTSLGAGWDHELFSVGDKWILRFPKRAERIPWLEREVEIMAVVGESLGPTVPRFELIGRPSRTFPYPFVGYRRLPGVGADELAAVATSGLAEDVGRVLSSLHRVDPRRVPSTPASWEQDSWIGLAAELVAVADILRPLLAPQLLEKTDAYLAGRVSAPAQDGPKRFIHNDICPDHLIVDPDSSRLVGLIDFTDAMVGEVVLDMVGLIGIGGYDFIAEVLVHYDLPLEHNFEVKLRWLCQALTLKWLAEAATHDLDQISKHMGWVANAFEPRSFEP